MISWVRRETEFTTVIELVLLSKRCKPSHITRSLLLQALWPPSLITLSLHLLRREIMLQVWLWLNHKQEGRRNQTKKSYCHILPICQSDWQGMTTMHQLRWYVKHHMLSCNNQMGVPLGSCIVLCDCYVWFVLRKREWCRFFLEVHLSYLNLSCSASHFTSQPRGVIQLRSISLTHQHLNWHCGSNTMEYLKKCSLLLPENSIESIM